MCRENSITGKPQKSETHKKSNHPKISITIQKHGVQQDNFSGQFLFFIFDVIIFCFVVGICDLKHDVETIFYLSYVLTASGNLF